LFAALTAVGAQLMVPLPFSPVPIVLSNVVAVLSGLILGPQGGAIAETVYVLVGAAGLPIYAGFYMPDSTVDWACCSARPAATSSDL
jgi:biotin transport system substrate-specific component